MPLTEDTEQPEWRAPAARVAPLIDGEAYYRYLRDSLIEAHHQVLVVGWEVHSEIDLRRGADGRHAAREDGWPVRLSELLLALVRARPELHVYLLIWEGAALFLFERQLVPRMLRPWARHPRIRLVWDRDTPRLASQHQKVVVIDDAVAYAGGMDLTTGRWDTHAHRRNDPRRRGPGWLPSQSQPYHDLMMTVDGEAARTLGDWLRERWRRATGETIAPPAIPEDVDPWPRDLAPAFRDKEIGIALTQPEFGGRPEKRQVEATYLRQIAAARDLLFIETQYLTCRAIVTALCARLREPEGPEVIIILPFGCPGPVQSMSMDPWRDELLDDLRAADQHGRFGVYWATLHGGAMQNVFKNAVYIHAKTLVTDRNLIRIGSANLNNRSMGLDTELDVYLEAGDDDEAGMAAVDAYRRRLIANLLHVEPEAVARAEEAASGSVLGAIESIRGGERTLHPLDHCAGAFESTLPLPLELADPDHPLPDLEADRILEVFEDYKGLEDRVRQRLSESAGTLWRWKQLILACAAAVLLAVLWAATPLRDLVDREWLHGALERIRTSPAGMLGVGGAFVILATTGFPVSLLIAVTGAMLPVAWAIPLCLAGVLVSAFLNYSLGRFAPRSICDAISNRALDQVIHRVQGLSVLGVAIARNIPIAPYTVVNIACGAIGVPRWRFLIGTLAGMTPAIVLMSIFGQELGRLVIDPTPLGIARVAGLVVAVGAFAVVADTALRRFERRRKSTKSGGA